MTLAITAIVAAAALATIAFAIPQQVMAYRHHHHTDNHKSIKVDQQVNQQNQCSGQPQQLQELAMMRQVSSTLCINEGNNSAEIHR